MLAGIIPILFVPFSDDGELDKAGLRKILQFELDAGVHGIGINGFASEAYKLSDEERYQTVDIVATELAGAVPLIIGIAPGSTEAGMKQIQAFARYQPACFMVLPPVTMDNGPEALLEHYLALAAISDSPIMVQQSPHIPAYRHTLLSAEYLAELALRADAICYYKIEGSGAPERMKALLPLIDKDRVGLFGGVGGISFLEELQLGARGVIPGVGFNEVFLETWQAWQRADAAEVRRILRHYQPLVNAVSAKGHEFSLHARKQLMKRQGLIQSAFVRRPTVAPKEDELEAIFATADRYPLRVSRGARS